MRSRARTALAAALVPVVAWLAHACGTSSDGGAGAPQAASHDDALQGDAQSALDAADAEDVGLDGFAPDAFGADAADASDEHDITQTSNWSTFDLTGLFANAKTFAGAAFDGRYAYLAPGATGQ